MQGVRQFLVNLELEPFNNFSKFVDIVLLLLALSTVIAHNFKKNKENEYLVEKFIQKKFLPCLSNCSLLVLHATHLSYVHLHEIHAILQQKAHIHEGFTCRQSNESSPKYCHTICSSPSVHRE